MLCSMGSLDVAEQDVLVDRRRVVRQGLVGVVDRGQLFPLDLDRAHGPLGERLGARGDRRDALAHLAHHPRQHGPVPVRLDRDAHLALVVADVRYVVGSDADGPHPLGLARVDGHDARVRIGAAQHAGVEHVRQLHVRRVGLSPGDLGQPVLATGHLAHGPELLYFHLAGLASPVSCLFSHCAILACSLYV